MRQEYFGRIAKEFNSPVRPISLDWYLEPKWMPRDPVHGKNWETPAGCDFGLLARDLQRLQDVFRKAEQVPAELQVSADGQDIIVHEKTWDMAGEWLSEKPVVIVVEGFLLFYSRELTAMMHAQLWLEADFDVCLLRRHKRGRGSRKREVETSKDWFRDSVWYHYEWYKDTQRENSRDALCLDSNQAKESVHEEALDHCMKLLWRFDKAAWSDENERSESPPMETLRITLRPRRDVQEPSASSRSASPEPRRRQRGRPGRCSRSASGGRHSRSRKLHRSDSGGRCMAQRHDRSRSVDRAPPRRHRGRGSDRR